MLDPFRGKPPFARPKPTLNSIRLSKMFYPQKRLDRFRATDPLRRYGSSFERLARRLVRGAGLLRGHRPRERPATSARAVRPTEQGGPV